MARRSGSALHRLPRASLLLFHRSSSSGTARYLPRAQPAPVRYSSRSRLLRHRAPNSSATRACGVRNPSGASRPILQERRDLVRCLVIEGTLPSRILSSVIRGMLLQGLCPTSAKKARSSTAADAREPARMLLFDGRGRPDAVITVPTAALEGGFGVAVAIQIEEAVGAESVEPSRELARPRPWPGRVLLGHRVWESVGPGTRKWRPSAATAPPLGRRNDLRRGLPV